MKPILASAVENLDKLKFPLMVQPKLDGIRALKIDGQVVSRNLKPIRNKYVQENLKHIPNGLDGELVLLSSNEFNQVSSEIMSEAGEPDFLYVIFDNFLNQSGYKERYEDLEYKINDGIVNGRVELVRNHIVNSLEELLMLEEEFLRQGFEGLMIRSIDGKYKQGRSTEKEGILLKLKKFVDSEAEVIGFTELMVNNNEAKINKLGNTERSHHKENLVGGNTLGNLIVRDLVTKVEFEIGTGFTAKQREVYWLTKDSLLGKLVKYKYQKEGMKDKPRFPVFLGFRDRNDLDVNYKEG